MIRKQTDRTIEIELEIELEIEFEIKHEIEMPARMPKRTPGHQIARPHAQMRAWAQNCLLSIWTNNCVKF